MLNYVDLEIWEYENDLDFMIKYVEDCLGEKDWNGRRQSDKNVSRSPDLESNSIWANTIGLSPLQIWKERLEEVRRQWKFGTDEESDTAWLRFKNHLVHQLAVVRKDRQ